MYQDLVTICELHALSLEYLDLLEDVFRDIAQHTRMSFEETVAQYQVRPGMQRYIEELIDVWVMSKGLELCSVEVN